MKGILANFCLLLAMNTGYCQQSHFSWLLGKWKLENKPVFEVWSVANDQTALAGTSFSLTGSDTTLRETISLTFRNDKFHYIADIAGPQPPVDFTITTHSEEGFIAENPEHDFPKKIRYRHIINDGQDFMAASIEGNGKVIQYAFKKVK